MEKLLKLLITRKHSGNKGIIVAWQTAWMKSMLIVKLIASLLILTSQGCNSSEVKIKLNSPTIMQQQLNPKSTETEIPLNISALDEARLQIQLRIPFSTTSITLMDPTGHEMVDPDTPQITFVRRDAIKHPDRGDLYLLPEQINPKPGQWKIKITHKPATGDESIFITITLLERFLLHLGASQSQGSAGQPLILSILASDNGLPIKDLSPKIKILLNDQPVESLLTASKTETAESGIQLTDEPGIYTASFTPESPGTYRFLTEMEFQGEKDTILKKAATIIEVAPALVTLKKVAVESVPGADGCIKNLDFLVQLSVKKAGSYTVSLFLQTLSERDLELSSTQQGKAGVMNYRIPFKMKSQQIDQLSDSVEEIKRIEVLRFDDSGINILGRYLSIRIPSPFSPKKFCASG